MSRLDAMTEVGGACDTRDVDGSTEHEPDSDREGGKDTEGVYGGAVGCEDPLNAPSHSSHKHGLHRLRQIVYDAPLKYNVLHGVRRLLHYASQQRTSAARCASCGLKKRRKGNGREESADDACCGCTQEQVGQVGLMGHLAVNRRCFDKISNTV